MYSLIISFIVANCVLTVFNKDNDDDDDEGDATNKGNTNNAENIIHREIRNSTC